MAQLERPTLDGSVRGIYFGWLTKRDLLWMAQLERPTLDGSVRDAFLNG